MKGCNNCNRFNRDTNKCIRWIDQTQFKQWWNRNGYKSQDDPTIEEMVCFEETEYTKRLNRLESLIDKLITKIDEKGI